MYAGSLPSSTCGEIVDLLRRQLARLLDACSRPELETDVITTVCDVTAHQPTAAAATAGKHGGCVLRGTRGLIGMWSLECVCVRA